MHDPWRPMRMAAAGLALVALSVIVDARWASAQSADLGVVQAALPDPVTAGTDLTYQVTVNNYGPSDSNTAFNVTLTDTVPANTTFVSHAQASGPAFTCTTPVMGGVGTITCTVATFGAGESAIFTLVVHVSASLSSGGSVDHTATVSSGTTDPEAANDSSAVSTTVATQADLSVTKAGPLQTTEGANIAYAIGVQNAGPSDAQGVTLADPLPAGTTFVSLSSPAGWACATPAVGGTGAVACARPALPSGASASFQLVVRVASAAPQGAVIANTAAVASSTADPNPANDAATATVATAPRDIVTGAGPGGGPHVRGFDLTGAATATSFMAYDPAFAGGVFVAAGNVDGSGPAEMVTGAGPGGGPHVRVFNQDDTDSGIGFMAYDTGFTGGVRVATCDVDGDGRDEIVTAAGPGGGPHVRVWTVSGTTVTLAAEFMAYDAAFMGGVFVGCGDVDGDGGAEIVTGADAGGGPHVRVWKVAGSTAMELFGFYAYDPAFMGGARVAVADVTGDGKADVVTGAGPGGGPHVRVFDGAQLLAGNAVSVRDFYAYDPVFSGGVYVAAGDLNGDGHADLVTGAGAGGGPHVRVVDGLSLAEIAGFYAYDPAFTGGVAVAIGP